MSPVLQMRKPRCLKVEEFAKGHTATNGNVQTHTKAAYSRYLHSYLLGHTASYQLE